MKTGIKQIPSSYIEGGFCYYRDSQYWADLAQECGIVLSGIFQSKPSYPFKRLLWLYSKLGLMRIFSVNIIKKVLYRNVKVKKERGVIDFSSEIQTVFIVMRKQ